MTKLTTEEVLNSYEFKIIKKVLKSEYPWIKDVVISHPEDINEYSLIFLDFIIDPIKLAMDEDWKFMWYAPSLINRGHRFPFFNTLYDIDYDTSKDEIDLIEFKMGKVKKSPALPHELKLPSDRKFAHSSFIIEPQELPENIEDFVNPKM